MKTLRMLVALAATLAIAAPAAADHATGEAFVPELIETPVYLHCEGPTKVANINQGVLTSAVTFDENAPSGSYTAGEGCGSVDPWIAGADPGNGFYDFPFSGTVEGNLDNVTFRLWSIDTAASRALDEFQVRVTIDIDGKRRLDDELVQVPVINSSTGVSRLFEFTLTDLGLLSEADHTGTHDVDVTIVTHNYADGNTINNWVYDAVEIDSGLVFNDATRSPHRVKAIKAS